MKNILVASMWRRVVVKSGIIPKINLKIYLVRLVCMQFEKIGFARNF